MEDGIEIEFAEPDSGYGVTLEDDGRVAYGCLIDPDGEIIANVWLYNRCAPPRTP